MTVLKCFFMLPSLQNHKSSLQNYRTNCGRYLASITHSSLHLWLLQAENHKLRWMDCEGNSKHLFDEVWISLEYHITITKLIIFFWRNNLSASIGIGSKLVNIVFMSIAWTCWDIFIIKRMNTMKVRSDFFFYWQLLGRSTQLEL